MGETTGISWCDHTHNEWEGCFKISPACASCYAAVSTPVRVLRAKGLEVWGPAKTTPRHRTSEANRRKPFAWNRTAKAEGVRRRVFCSSLSDVFEEHPMLDAWRLDLWRTIEACDGLDWQLLTKRPENILRMVPPSWRDAWPAHVWIGTTVEDQRRAEERIPHLLEVPAAVRFLSYEPALEAVDLSEWIAQQSNCSRCGSFDGFHDLCPGCGQDSLITTWGEEQHARWASGERYENNGPHPVDDGPQIHWVIAGGESGPGARPFDLAWARSIVAQCREAGVACFVKQLGARPYETTQDRTYVDDVEDERPLRYRDRAGADPAEWPADLRVQQFPEVR